MDSMKRAALYSRTSRSHTTELPVAEAPAQVSSRRARMQGFLRRHRAAVFLALGLLVAATIFLAAKQMPAPPRELIQDDIDAAVLHTLETKTLPSRAAKAAEAVRQAVVRVRGYSVDPKEPQAGEKE